MSKTTELLTDHGVHYWTWGRGESKTLAHLEKEVEDGESVLIEENGRLIRQVRILNIDVLFHTGYFFFESNWYRLKEDRQEFSDGRIRRRNLPSSLAEKLKAEEVPCRGSVARALREEIGFQYRPFYCRKIREWEEEKDSPSYPGLFMRAEISLWLASLLQEDCNENGYVEIQEDKKTFFVWERTSLED